MRKSRTNPTIRCSFLTTDELQACLDAYWQDNSFLKYIYDLSGLQIHDLNEYYVNCLLISIPLLSQEATPIIDILYNYLYFADEVATYYSDDLYEAIKTLVQTTVDLVDSKILSAMEDAFTFLEVGLEYMNLPAITATPDSESKNALLYVFFAENWYVIDLYAELEEEFNDDKLYLLGAAEAPTIDSNYIYPVLARTRYVHTYYEIEYSLEKRPCQADELCEEVSLLHCYFYNTFSEPLTHYNIKVTASIRRGVKSNELLIPPQIVGKEYWTRGYFCNIEHYDESFKLEDYGFYSIGKDKFFNEYGNELTSEPQLLGTYGVATIIGIAEKINQELIIAGII